MTLSSSLTKMYIILLSIMCCVSLSPSNPSFPGAVCPFHSVTRRKETRKPLWLLRTLCPWDHLKAKHSQTKVIVVCSCDIKCLGGTQGSSKEQKLSWKFQLTASVSPASFCWLIWWSIWYLFILFLGSLNQEDASLHQKLSLELWLTASPELPREIFAGYL